MDVIAAGRTLWLRGPGLSKPHIWLIVTDVIPNPERIVAVMVRTSTVRTDPTLILKPGDHPFIKHPSSVHYSTANYIPMQTIRTALQNGNCHLREDQTKELLARVRAGLLRSPFTVHAIKATCLTMFE